MIHRPIADNQTRHRNLASIILMQQYPGNNDDAARYYISLARYQIETRNHREPIQTVDQTRNHSRQVLGDDNV